MNTSSLESSSQELNDDVNYINGLLNNFGMEEFPFKTIFSKELAGSKFVMLDNKARVCSLLIQLLHSKQKEEIFRRDSEDRSGRLLEEIRNLEIQQKRQDERVKLQDRELTGQRQNNQILTEKQRHLESNAHSLREELTKLKQTFAQKDRQFQHEIRKKEKEFEKLKDQLAAVLKDMQLREQKSEIQYNSQQSAVLHVDAEIFPNEDDEELVEEELNFKTDRFVLIESENDRLRQILTYNYGSLVQLVVDLFPELELDQTILGLLETSPLEWIEETLAHKVEELFEILRENLINLASQQHKSISQEQEEALVRLNGQCKTANLTISAQAETIKSLEQKLAEMEIYCKKVESLEMEKSRLQDLLSRNEKNENNNNSILCTPKWMKTTDSKSSINRSNSRSRSLSPDSSDFGNSPIIKANLQASPYRSERSVSPSRSRSHPVKSDGFFLGVRNLTRNVSEAHLKEIFGVYGEIVGLVYPMHPNTGYPTGRAVIQFTNEQSVLEAIRCMNEGQIDGNVIICEVSQYSYPPRPIVHEARNFTDIRDKRGYAKTDRYIPNRMNRNRNPVPVRRSSFSRSPSPVRRRNRGYSRRRSISRSLSRSRSRRPISRSLSRSRSRRPISRSLSRSRSRRPISRSRSPIPIRRRPVSRSRSPIRRRPISRSRSPIRRRSISRSRSPIRRRSPARRLSTSARSRTRSRSRSRSRPPIIRGRRQISRSPSQSKSYYRRRSPSYGISPNRNYKSKSFNSRSPSPLRGPRRFSPSPIRRRSPRRQSPSRSPIPVSRMNY